MSDTDKKRFEGQPAYFSWIPAPVLASQSISDKGKLLYGLISGLVKDLGYCYASNAYFAGVLKCGVRTITRLLRELVDAGEIIIDDVPDGKFDGNRQRRIYTRETASRSIDKIGRAASFGEASIDKNGEALNMYDKKVKITPYSPPEGGKRAEPWKPDRFESFWRFYRTDFCGADHNRAGTKAAAAKAWTKLKPTDEQIAALGLYLSATKRTQQWRDGVGIPYASTLLNRVRRGDIDISELPEDVAPDSARSADDAAPRRFGVWH